MVALGAVAAHAQYAPGLTPLETSKAWSLSADLRGFYDDNYLTLPKQFRESTWGTELSPSAAVNHSVQDTLMSASYVYDLRWYATHSATDQSHQFNGRIEHEFSDRYKLSVSDSFVIAQEPTLIDTAVISTPLREEGNNVRNTGQLGFTAGLTKLLDLHLGYDNTLYAYQQKDASVVGGVYVPSRSAQLDRIEQLATLDLRWKATPDTTGVLGYQFGNVDYTSPGLIIAPNILNSGFVSKVRNVDEHYVFVGADESFTPDLNGSIRAGGEFVDYYNTPDKLTRLSPYVDANLTWQYTAQSSAQVGVKVVHNATDVTGFTSPVLDTQATVLYASVNHNVTDHLSISLMGQAQFSVFNEGNEASGSINGDTEDFYVFGLNIAYHFNPWLLTEAGYDYSKLNSQIPDRGYTRNQLYLGFRGTY